MKLIVCHNFYRQPGGEDQVFFDEVRLLESRGHQVVRFTAHNRDIDEHSRLRLARTAIWNGRACEALLRDIDRERPDVVHLHNTFPLISPAIYQAARRHGAAIVQTLHNFRLLCPSATMFRGGRVCESCLGKRVAWPSVLHGCYRGSRSASAAVAAMLAVHHSLGTWRQAVDVYIALTDFARRKFIEGGLPAERIVVKPNFVAPEPPIGHGAGRYALFVGRLSPEKGIATLLAAWEELAGEVPLKIVGDGPLADEVRAAAGRNSSIEWLGWQSQEQVFQAVGDASLFIVPSDWYEGCPRTIVEAFAKGTPVLASRLGGLAEIVDDERTGALFTQGDAADLARQVRRLFADRECLASMRRAAREEFELKYGEERNYSVLMEAYERAIAGRGIARPAAVACGEC
ncbi:MAG TPA: glycosyltransferase family 4 protein [Pirellulales bacterium]|jgi:glycosyltransferase involved in cell wall biosynthesis|nr:glycosyltransferase family 4 protein [Pirellulales bacterium]